MFNSIIATKSTTINIGIYQSGVLLNVKYKYIDKPITNNTILFINQKGNQWTNLSKVDI